MTNKLYLGFSKEIELPKRKFLILDDDFDEETLAIPHARVFDPTLHSFNPLKDMSHKRARELADVLSLIYPQGENTLTVRNLKRLLPHAIYKAKSFEDITGEEEVTALVSDILFSPILKSVLCNPMNEFFRKGDGVVLARLNRAELGEFDALVLGLLLINQFKGQLVIPSLEFYGRDAHVSLIREKRLIAGVTSLQELPTRLRNSVLSIKDKTGSGTTLDDAETLVQFTGLERNTNGYNAFVQECIS